MKRSITTIFMSLFAALICSQLIFNTAMSQTNFVKYSENPILPLGSPGIWDDTEAAYADVIFYGGEYHLWYTGAPTENIYRIGYASSADGINWNKHPDPVLGVGTPGSFDDQGLWLPNVFVDSAGFKMWYSGNLGESGIGLATSSDPINWSRAQSLPVLAPGAAGTFDVNYAFLPCILYQDNTYHMWYTGRNAGGTWQTGYATSTDGVNWSKFGGNPVLSAGPSGAWDSRAAAAGTVIYENGEYHMWYHGTNRNDNTETKIGYATSPDGINWTKYTGNPVLSRTPGSWDATNVWFPRVIKEGHRYRMWYTGRRTPTNSVDRFGYAEDFSQAAHTDSVFATPDTVVFMEDSLVHITATIANPHNETLFAKAQILSEDGSMRDTVDLVDIGGGVWEGEWQLPSEMNNYKVGVILENITAGYTHNSLNWGVFDEFGPVMVGISDDLYQNIPNRPELKQNYPNPFNPSTTIEFKLPQNDFVTLRIYNALGEAVATLLEAQRPAGNYTIKFDASQLSSGIYYYSLITKNAQQTRKMVLMR